MATTPPLRTAVHTPPTPLHGARLDSYQPYSTRKSTRHTKQRSQRVNQTPPLSSDLQSQSELTSHSRDGSTRLQHAHTYSPPSSTQTSPQKKLFRAGKSAESTKMNEASSSLDPLTLEPSQNPDDSSLLHFPTANTGVSMLPTPAKTPRKKRVHSAAVASAARVLFPVRTETVEEAMPTPRKRGRKRNHVGFSLNGSFEDDDTNSEDKIQIFTDSKDKVPEMDLSEENPFYDHSAQPGPSQESHKTKGGRKKNANTAADVSKEIEEAFNHEEGMVYVFRGKKIFRKFAEEHSPLQHSGIGAEPSSRLRPFTRSSVKPRLLFPTAAQRQDRSLAVVDDEEAITDIEELPPLPDDSELTDLAPETEEEALITPVKDSFAAPTTPPTTGHATRAATRKAKLYSSASEPVQGLATYNRRSEKKLGSFDGWQRTKATVSAAGRGKKRGGEALEKDGVRKKLRG